MPYIRGQRTTPALTDGFEIDTVEYGKRRVAFLELGGNDLRLTFYLNDIQVSTEDLSNPSLTEIGTRVCAGLFPGAPVSADGKSINVGNGHLYVSWHVVTRSPLSILIRTDNVPPPANWWQV